MAYFGSADTEQGDIFVEFIRYLTEYEVKNAEIVKRILKTVRQSENAKTKLEDLDMRYSLCITNMQQLKALVGSKNSNIDEIIRTIEDMTTTDIREIKRGIQSKAEERHNTEKNISAMQQYETKRTNELEADIQTMKDTKLQKNYNIEKKCDEIQKKFAALRAEFEKKMEKSQKYKTEKETSIQAEIERMKEFK